ncbi:apicoplast import protein Tic20, putative [Plasmodium gallinaceum]|uniref:Apicoplast import protein Tic20, putative n=1 Tax=Plasmodium gallinaceum TaxID=5849 RepID=A0A1J1GVC0_PLAGA|nr:apicoplast import protein Tic20, putative [Plasmodium gallinaceum]CRG96497.1 apicoplast import protein Tic20, putative [Plasmodium gallinaceum]
MFNFLLIFILIYFSLINNVLSFQISPKIKTYSLKKINFQNFTNYKYADNKRKVNVSYYLKKNRSTYKCIRKKKIFMSLKNKISLIFHGESDITILDKCIASISYILPFMDAVQAFVMPLVNILPTSLHKYLFQIEKINQIYSSIPFLSFVTFMGLYFLFVKDNKFKFHYFIKYHHMESLILSMFGYALALFYFRVFPYSYNDTDIFNLTILYSTMAIYFGSLIIPFFASLLGYYIEIPVLSEAIKLHIGEKKIQGEDI